MFASNLILVEVLGLLSSAWAFNCSIPPIYIDVHKRIVHGTDIFQYGAFTGVGLPGQNQSLFPSFRQNETSVADINFCSESNLTDCSISTHGNFDPSESSTWIANPDYQTVDDTEISTSSYFGQDLFHLYTHYFETDPAFENIVTNFTVEVATNGTQNPGVVGLGLQSSLLQTMFNEGLIAGRTFGIYVGSGMDRAGGVINGSITWGGYDEGRFEGEVHNYTVDTSSVDPFVVTVSDIIINDPTGLVQNVSLFDPASFDTLDDFSGSFDARITTDQYPISLPYSVTQNFIKTLAAVPSDNPDGSLTLSKPFNGTMTIVLSDGFTIDLPNEVMYNVSGISPVQSRDESSTEPFYLGLSYLSQVYLMANYDAYSFHLAQAIPQQSFVSPKTFCPKSTPIAYIPPSSDSFASTGMIGAVIGGIFGGIFFVVGAWCLFVFWKRNRMAKKEVELEAARCKAKSGQFEVESDDALPKKPSKFAAVVSGLGSWKR